MIKLILNIIGSNENFVKGFSMNLFLKISMRRNIRMINPNPIRGEGR